MGRDAAAVIPVALRHAHTRSTSRCLWTIWPLLSAESTSEVLQARELPINDVAYIWVVLSLVLTETIVKRCCILVPTPTMHSCVEKLQLRIRCTKANFEQNMYNVCYVSPSIACFPSVPSSNLYIGQSNNMDRLIQEGRGRYNERGSGMRMEVESRYSL